MPIRDFVGNGVESVVQNGEESLGRELSGEVRAKVSELTDWLAGQM